MEKGFKCTKHRLFQNTPNYEVVLRDLSYCYCSIFMFKKNHLPRETLFIHTNQIQASERRRLFLCCKLPCQKHGLSFLTTVSYLLCSHTAWQAGHRERLQSTLLCRKRDFKKVFRGSDGWGRDLLTYRWAGVKGWKHIQVKSFQMGKMSFKDSVCYPSAMPGSHRARWVHQKPGSLLSENCCILREICGWTRTAKRVTFIVYVFKSRFHISFNETGKDFNFFFFFKTNYLDFTPIKKPKTIYDKQAH